jgi:CDGSH-type Zn-finger protein
MASTNRESAPSTLQEVGPEALRLPAGVHHLCACGRSRQGWFCDGAHLGSGRIAFELRLDQEQTVMLCRCGQSRRYPLCDGHHAKGRDASAKGSRRPWWRRWL